MFSDKRANNVIPEQTNGYKLFHGIRLIFTDRACVISVKEQKINIRLNISAFSTLSFQTKSN